LRASGLASHAELDAQLLADAVLVEATRAVYRQKRTTRFLCFVDAEPLCECYVETRHGLLATLVKAAPWKILDPTITLCSRCVRRVMQPLLLRFTDAEIYWPRFMAAAQPATPTSRGAAPAPAAPRSAGAEGASREAAPAPAAPKAARSAEAAQPAQLIQDMDVVAAAPPTLQVKSFEERSMTRLFRNAQLVRDCIPSAREDVVIDAPGWRRALGIGEQVLDDATRDRFIYAFEPTDDDARLGISAFSRQGVVIAVVAGVRGGYLLADSDSQLIVWRANDGAPVNVPPDAATRRGGSFVIAERPAVLEFRGHVAFSLEWASAERAPFVRIIAPSAATVRHATAPSLRLPLATPPAAPPKASAALAGADERAIEDLAQRHDVDAQRPSLHELWVEIHRDGSRWHLHWTARDGYVRFALADGTPLSHHVDAQGTCRLRSREVVVVVSLREGGGGYQAALDVTPPRRLTEAFTNDGRHLSSEGRQAQAGESLAYCGPVSDKGFPIATLLRLTPATTPKRPFQFKLSVSSGVSKQQ
jgi:hypothetical protein